LRRDLDQVEALTSERETLWARIHAEHGFAMTA
jgi:hypothetical protein